MPENPTPRNVSIIEPGFGSGFAPQVIARGTWDGVTHSGTYAKVNGEMYPLGYLFPAEDEQKVLIEFHDMYSQRKELEDRLSSRFYQLLNTYSNWRRGA